jgi:hypothetical protein
MIDSNQADFPTGDFEAEPVLHDSNQAPFVPLQSIALCSCFSPADFDPDHVAARLRGFTDEDGNRTEVGTQGTASNQRPDDMIFVDEWDEEINPLGIKGVGEIGIAGVAPRLPMRSTTRQANASAACRRENGGRCIRIFQKSIGRSFILATISLARDALKVSPSYLSLPAYLLLRSIKNP